MAAAIVDFCTIAITRPTWVNEILQ